MSYGGLDMMTMYWRCDCGLESGLLLSEIAVSGLSEMIKDDEFR